MADKFNEEMNEEMENNIIELIDAEKVKATGTQELAEYSQKLIAESIGEVRG